MKLLFFILILIIIFIVLMLLIDHRKKTEIVNKYKNKEHRSGKLEKINGVNIYYIEVGEGEPLLIIHGFMASCIEYTEIIEILSKEFRIIAVDLIGFGRSDKRLDLDYSKKNMADLVAALLISKGYDKINVLAHSMGGEVGLNLAYHYSNIVKSLILVDSVGYKDIKWPLIPKAVLQYIFKMYYLQKLFYKYCFYNRKFCNIDKFERIFYLNSLISAETINSFSRRNDKHKIGCKIRSISCPTLIIWGKYDRVVPIKSAYKFKDDIKQSRLIIFQNSGHLPYSEEESNFIACVKEFICTNNISN